MAEKAILVVEYQCGCKIMELSGPFITYCPRHAAADAMLEALKNAREWFEATGYHKDYSGEYCLYSDYDPGDTVDEIDSALALATEEKE